MVSDTLEVFCHHDQIKGPLAVLAFFFLDKIDHLIADFLEVLVDLIVGFHDALRELKISVYVRCHTVAHHLADFRSHRTDHVDLLCGSYAFGRNDDLGDVGSLVSDTLHIRDHLKRCGDPSEVLGYRLLLKQEL